MHEENDFVLRPKIKASEGEQTSSEYSDPKKFNSACVKCELWTNKNFFERKSLDKGSVFYCFIHTLIAE